MEVKTLKSHPRKNLADPPAGDVFSGILDVENPDALDAPPEFLENLGRAVIREIARIQKSSQSAARKFVDTASFDQILRCFDDGESFLADYNQALLALVFCHISTH